MGSEFFVLYIYLSDKDRLFEIDHYTSDDEDILIEMAKHRRLNNPSYVTIITKYKLVAANIVK